MNLPDFSNIFHQSSKSHQKGHPPIPASDKEWPDEWKTTYYKVYPRLPNIDLSDEPPQKDFFDLVKKRRSRRDFTRGTITKKELSLLLKFSCGNMGAMGEGRHRRAQPSAGGRFPIEVYPIIFRSAQARTNAPARPKSDEGGDSTRTDAEDLLKAGLYHYNVKDHKLDVLWDHEFSDEEIGKIFTYPWVKDAAVGIVMTSVFWRNQNKYGERGYRYILLEAGHIGQNLYLVSEAIGLKCCAVGTRDESIEKLIDIDGVTESVVYGFAIGT